MKRFLWISISGIILLSGVLTASHAGQPAGSPAIAFQTECNCSQFEDLQIELRNALHLQKAFQDKIPELRSMNGDSAQIALKAFAEGAARNGLETNPNYKGPKEFDYSPWGENQRTFDFPNEKLCGMSRFGHCGIRQGGVGFGLRRHWKGAIRNFYYPRSLSICEICGFELQASRSWAHDWPRKLFASLGLLQSV